jgi:hypothetical protein
VKFTRKYIVVTDWSPQFLLSSWLLTLKHSSPEAVYIRTPKKRGFIKYLRLLDKIVFGAVGFILSIFFVALVVKNIDKIAKIRLKKFRGWDALSKDTNFCAEIDFIYITTDSIVPASFFEQNQVKVINKHAADTKKMRGLLPLFWTAMAHQEPVLTVHCVNEKIDDGAIIFQTKIQPARESLLSCYMAVYFDIWPTVFADESLLESVEVEEAEAKIPDYKSWPQQNDIAAFYSQSDIKFSCLGDVKDAAIYAKKLFN